MKKFTSSVLIVFASLAVAAQTGSGSISGAVTEAGHKPVESASISLHRAADSALIKLSIGDARGAYRFEGIPGGRYLVSVTAVGHARAWSAPIVLADGAASRNIGIELQPVEKTMAGVTVTARRPLIEQKIDRTVINVDASISNVGATALEVLEKSPGVSVDKDGNISLKGKQGVQVYLDGRQAYLSGAELASYLKGLPASAIDQIEIMTNPSSKYDAAGNAGIINIKSKKSKTRGFNGSLNLALTQSRYTQYSNSANVNFRTGKMNLFASINQKHGNRWQALDILRRYQNEATGGLRAIFEQESRMHSQNDNFGLKLGADYFLTKRTTLGIVFSGFSNPETFTSKSSSFLENAQGVTDSIVYAESRSRQQFRNGSVNVNFRTQFDTLGRELTADVDAIRYHSYNNQHFFSDSYNPAWEKQRGEELRSDLPVDISIYSAKTDYVHPLRNGLKLEAGLKTSFVATSNGSFYFNTTGTTETSDSGKTYQFNYCENISAAYVNVNKQAGKWGLQGGLRYERTFYKGHQFGSPDHAQHPDSIFTRRYGSLFPTAFISFNAAKNHQFSLSYGRRIDRPAYQDLNPFLFFLDKYTYQQGNPYMRPQFTHNVELAHTFKGFLTTTLNWSRTTDLLIETFLAARDAAGNQTYATIIKNGNIGRRDYWGISSTANVPVAKWWTLVLYANYDFYRFSGRLNGDGQELNAEGAVLLLNANNQFRFGKGWGAELSGFYRSRGVEGQVIVDPMSQVSIGLSKQVLNGKGTVKVGMRDVFFSNRQSGSINVPGTELHFNQSRDSRAGSISFVWRFGKPLKDAAPRRVTGAASDEMNRVKGAN